MKIICARFVGLVLSTGLIFVSTTSFADEAKKTRLIKEYVDGLFMKTINNAVDNEIRILIDCDSRLRGEPGYRRDLETKFNAVIDKSELKSQKIKGLTERFTESEITYTLERLNSDVGLKWNAGAGEDSKVIVHSIKTRLKDNFERVTGLPYRDPLDKDPKRRCKPNWLTKIVWKIYPDQRFGCE